MHLITLGAWVLYVFCHVCARPENVIAKAVGVGGVKDAIEVFYSDGEDELAGHNRCRAI